ncbi:MAG: 50S ribosomal protein L10 [Promethearchaeota archaeon]
MSTGASQEASSDAPRTQQGRLVPQAKLEEISRLSSLLEQYEYICLIRTENIGSKQLQRIKKALRGDALILMAKNSIMIRAIQKITTKKGLSELIPYIQGSCAFAFSNANPFELNAMLQQNKTKAPAKAGSTSPIDITVTAGNTGFPPGPLISELGQVGLKTRVQGGSIWITEDHLMVKAGETVSRAQALVLSRLGIEPYEIYLKITAAYDSGTILSAIVFELSTSDLIAQFQEAAQAGRALALAINYISPETLPQMLQKAYTEARSLVLATGFLTDDLMPHVLARAEQQASALARMLTDKNPDSMSS